MGRWSEPVNAIAVGWLLIIVPALCFPAAKGADLTLQTMNWTSVIYGGAMSLAMIYYAVSGRHWFKGPRVNVEHIEGSSPPHSHAGDEKGASNMDAALSDSDRDKRS